MKVYISAPGEPDDLEIDINEELADTCCVDSVEKLFNRMLMDVAAWCITHGITPFDVYCNTFDGDDEAGLDLGMASGSDFYGTLLNVANLSWYIMAIPPGVDEARVFALIAYRSPEYFDFDDIKNLVEGDFHGEIEEDVEEWAKRYLEETDQDLPNDLKCYFDYERFGQDVIAGLYVKAEWNGREFLYSA